MYAQRNRQIKKTLELAFGRGKVAVRGHRGTAHGWATVKIAYSPRNWDEAKELQAKVMQLMAKASIAIGTYGTPGDMGCDYGWGSKIHINFDECQDRVAAREAIEDFNYVGSRHHY